MANTKSAAETPLLLLAVASIFFGTQYSALFYVLACALLASALCARPRFRTAGIILLGLSLFYLMVGFGYNVGKDLAKRDNARDAVTQVTTQDETNTQER